MLPTSILVLIAPPLQGRLTDEREQRRSFREMEREQRKREAGGGLGFIQNCSSSPLAHE